MSVGQHINNSRRSFLRMASFASGAYFFEPYALGEQREQAPLRLGLIADVHQDIMHDGCQRIKSFADAMNGAKADSICQLGDFCQPLDRNRGFLENWSLFAGPRYHVLGNHDTDGGHAKEKVMAFWGMRGSHYSFDQKGVHIVILDGNDPGGKSKGYKRFMGPEQIEWLKADLKSASLPTLAFSHQTLDDSTGIENSEEVRKVFEDVKCQTGKSKVVACFCGHHHDDQARQINGIHYIRINSASYSWLGSNYKHESYDKEIHKKFSWISSTAPYKAPLWALVEIDVAKGKLTVQGIKSSWVGPTPWELGVPKEIMDPTVCTPQISDRALNVRASS